MPKSWNNRYARKPAGTLGDDDYFHIALTFGGRTRKVLAHRIVFALSHGYWPPEQLDHENGAEVGNGIANLHAATHAQNGQNQKMHATNTSGFPGVHWDKRTRRWRVGIKVGQHKFRDRFDTPEGAFIAYCAAKAILHPFAPVPRGVPMLELNPVDRMKTAHRIVLAARSGATPCLNSMRGTISSRRCSLTAAPATVTKLPSGRRATKTEQRVLQRLKSMRISDAVAARAVTVKIGGVTTGPRPDGGRSKPSLRRSEMKIVREHRAHEITAGEGRQAPNNKLV